MAETPTGEPEEIPTRRRTLSVVLLVVFTSLSLGSFFSGMPLVFGALMGGLSQNIRFALETAFSFIGMGIVGGVYLHHSGRGLDYIDISRPDRETAISVLIGGIAVLLVAAVIGLVQSVVGAPAPPENPVTEQVGSKTQMLLIMFGIVVFFNAPIEEFIFRNIVQKRLIESFHAVSAILITSLLFSSLHLPGYLTTGAALEATVAPLATIFAGSIIFGAIYVYTEDLLAVIGAHAVYNISSFALSFFATAP
jgi:membrane protease YdiL (CAAX protease family)